MGKLNPTFGAGQAFEPSGGAPGESARQASLRAANLRLLLQCIYTATEPPSRADLATITGMTRSTASRLVDDLLAAELIAQTSPARTTGPGRPAARLTAAHGSHVALGMEITTSSLAVRAVDLSGTVLDEGYRAGGFAGSRPQHALAALGELVDALTLPDGVRLLGAGLALPGLVTADGRLLSAPNLGWSDIDPVPLVRSARLRGVAVHVGNEADFAARAVTWARPGRPGTHRDFLYVSAEVGIGGSIVFGGEPLRGRHGWAGEIGHVTVDPSGPECRCGSYGCLERYAGRQALRINAGVDVRLEPHELVALAAAGHPGVTSALAKAGWALGIAVADAVNLLDVPLVVLGGDLALLMEWLRPAMQDQLHRRILAAAWSTPALMALPGPHLAATGAAYRVLGDALSSLPGVLPESRIDAESPK